MSFSWSDRRQGGTNLSCIDRFYVSDHFGVQGGAIGILAGTSFSNHAPVILALEEQLQEPSLQQRIPDSIVSDANLSEDIERIWWESQSMDLDAAEQCAHGITALNYFMHECYGTT